MAKKFLTPINVTNLSSDPGSAIDGDIYYNTVSDNLKLYANGAWTSVSASGGAGVTSITGTSNEIDVSASTGAITLSLPSTINVDITGSATTLTNARTIQLSGDVSGSVSFNGSSDVNIVTGIQPNSITLGTQTTGNYVATVSAGDGINVTGSGSENAAITISNTGIVSLIGTANQISASTVSGSVTLALPNTVTFPGTVTLNADPSNALEAATKQYVDNAVAGLDWHPAVNLLAASAIALTGTSGTLIVDGHSALGDTDDGYRLLLKGQTSASANGIYVYSDDGSTYTLSRATDADAYAELEGAAVFVMEGDTYASTAWVQSNHYLTDFSGQTWTQFSGSGTYTAGTGLQLDGTTFSNTGVLSLTGTSNEIDVSASSGSITLSLPSTINANTTGSAATLTTSRTIELLGDVTGSASFNGGSDSSITSTLANTAVSPASYGSASAIGTFTVDSKGRLTAASNVAVAIAQSAVTDLVSDLSAKAPLASPALTGTPTAPTAAYDDDSTQIATTEYVQNAIERITINTQTSSYALDLADAGEVVEMNSASANTITVPLNSTKAFPIGSTIDIVQYGAGQTTIAGESVGVTIRSKENKLKLTSQYSAATLYKRGTDEWIVFGDLSS